MAIPAGILKKLERADKHLAELRSQIFAYLGQQPAPYATDQVWLSLGTECSFRAWRTADVPLDLSVVVGEIVHQLRSSLDHLVVALAKKNGQEATLSHQFPIVSTGARFDQAINAGRLRGVGGAEVDRIRQMQPMNEADPDDNFLSLLAALNNADKHRNLIVTTGAASMNDLVTFGTDEDLVARTGIDPHQTVIGLREQRVLLSRQPQEYFAVILQAPQPAALITAPAKFSVSLSAEFRGHEASLDDLLGWLRTLVGERVEQFSASFD